MSEQQELFCYKQMPVWTADEIPEALLSKHNTAAGTWGCLNVLQGHLNFNELDEAGNITATHELTPESGDWIIHPQAWHFIAPQTQDTEIQLSFYCEAADYFNKKYGSPRRRRHRARRQGFGYGLRPGAQCAVSGFERF